MSNLRRWPMRWRSRPSWQPLRISRPPCATPARVRPLSPPETARLSEEVEPKGCPLAQRDGGDQPPHDHPPVHVRKSLAGPTDWKRDRSLEVSHRIPRALFDVGPLLLLT